MFFDIPTHWQFQLKQLVVVVVVHQKSVLLQHVRVIRIKQNKRRTCLTMTSNGIRENSSPYVFATDVINRLHGKSHQSARPKHTAHTKNKNQRRQRERERDNNQVRVFSIFGISGETTTSAKCRYCCRDQLW